MRWLWLALMVSNAACDRPRVLSQRDDAAPPGEVFTGPVISINDATSLVSSLVAARNTRAQAEIVALYRDGARILSWHRGSSWTYSPTEWAAKLASREGVSKVVSVHVIGFNSHRRIVATIDRDFQSTTTRKLLLLKTHRDGMRWLVDLEAEIDELDLGKAALSSYSEPLVADLSYRADPELAILRLRTTSSTHPELRLDDLRDGHCPSEKCEASLSVDLLTFSLNGNKRLDTQLETQTAECAKLPATRLAGAVRVFERDALVIERSAQFCAGAGELLTTSILGVRGQLTKTLLSLERSRVLEVEGNSVTVEHRASAGTELKSIRFVAGKEQDRLVFRAEEADLPTIKASK